jgi:hypothetical protein
MGKVCNGIWHLIGTRQRDEAVNVFLHGWIKKHRKVQNGWIWENAEYYRAWDAILFNVNYKPGNKLIKSKLIPYDRGESLRSLESWGTLFGGWSKGKVRRFFDLLEKDGMIVTQSVTVTTRLTVVNYSEYQDCADADETQNRTQAERKRNASGTQSKKVKNPKNEKKYNPRKAASDIPEIKDETWNEWIDHKIKMKASVGKRAIDRNIKQLREFGMRNANEILEQSIDNGWKGLFDSKNKSQQSFQGYVPKQDYKEI